MEDDTFANAITYILLLRVKSFPKMYVTLCPPKWYHSPPLAHALLVFSLKTREEIYVMSSNGGHLGFLVFFNPSEEHRN